MFWNQKQIFEKRLAETIKWCSPAPSIGDPRSVLRSIKLLPKRLLDEISDCAQGEPTSVDLPENDNKLASLFLNSNPHKLIIEIAKRRSEIVKTTSQKVEKTSTTWLLNEGRLLTWEFDNSNFDGACQSITNGFFGLNDDPPWDTWVHYFKGYETRQGQKGSKEYLLCWIPSTFFELVNDAIPCACFDTLVWLDQLAAKENLEIPKWLAGHTRKIHDPQL